MKLNLPLGIGAPAAGVLLWLGAACVTSGGNEPPERVVLRPWTSQFLRPAVLVADEVSIEGPQDLLEHFASTQDPANTDYLTKTTEDGLLQQTRVRPGIGGIDIRAQLDGLQIRALRKLTILQRPDGEAPVIVTARGDAWWSLSDGSKDLRQETLQFRGDRAR